MAWLPDEQYVLMQDTRDKAITARSARHTRTHNGKGGAVKFPSDYLSAKEKRKLSGECKSYRMNDPMTWKEFKELPDDLKKAYIKALRSKYNVPDNAIADMMGVSQPAFRKFISRAGLGSGKRGRNRIWDKDGFLAWKNGIKFTAQSNTLSEEEIREAENLQKACEEAMDDTVKEIVSNTTIVNVTNALQQAGHAADKLGDTMDRFTKAVPTNGTLVFEGETDAILRTIQNTLGNRYVKMSVQWSVADAPEVAPTVNFDGSALKKVATTIDYAILNEQRKKALGTMG